MKATLRAVIDFCFWDGGLSVKVRGLKGFIVRVYGTFSCSKLVRFVYLLFFFEKFVLDWLIDLGSSVLS